MPSCVARNKRSPAEGGGGDEGGRGKWLAADVPVGKRGNQLDLSKCFPSEWSTQPGIGHFNQHCDVTNRSSRVVDFCVYSGNKSAADRKMFSRLVMFVY
jgi:hypothetical protein